jgi:hypothetical protein
MNLKEKLKYVKEKFTDFSNFLELEDFRSYLLFTLNSQAAANVLAQLGIGGSKDIINLPYNPYEKIFYQKVNLFSSGSLVVYVKTENPFEKFLVEKENSILKKNLTSNELELGVRGKKKFVIPEVSDCSYLENEEPAIDLKVDEIYHTLESYIAITEPNIIFIIEATNESEPDVLFTFNMMPEIPTQMNKKVLRLDVYLDESHATKGKTYLKHEEDYKISLLDDVKQVSHSELFKSSFSLLLRVKTLNKPS